jgi:hypothetical protein
MLIEMIIPMNSTGGRERDVMDEDVIAAGMRVLFSRLQPKNFTAALLALFELAFICHLENSYQGMYIHPLAYLTARSFKRKAGCTTSL